MIIKGFRNPNSLWSSSNVFWHQLFTQQIQAFITGSAMNGFNRISIQPSHSIIPSRIFQKQFHIQFTSFLTLRLGSYYQTCHLRYGSILLTQYKCGNVCSKIPLRLTLADLRCRLKIWFDHRYATYLRITIPVVFVILTEVCCHNLRIGTKTFDFPIYKKLANLAPRIAHLDIFSVDFELFIPVLHN